MRGILHRHFSATCSGILIDNIVFLRTGSEPGSPRSEEDPVADIQAFGQERCILPADRPFPGFHLRNVTLWNSGHVRQLCLGETLLVPRAAQGDARQGVVTDVLKRFSQGTENDVVMPNGSCLANFEIAGRSYARGSCWGWRSGLCTMPSKPSTDRSSSRSGQ